LTPENPLPVAGGLMRPSATGISLAYFACIFKPPYFVHFDAAANTHIASSQGEHMLILSF
jgi:hypothetical protein